MARRVQVISTSCALGQKMCTCPKKDTSAWQPRLGAWQVRPAFCSGGSGKLFKEACLVVEKCFNFSPKKPEVLFWFADDHDVQAFLTHSLTVPENVAGGGQQVSEDDRKRFEQEFDEYYQKLQKAKEE